MSGAAKNGDRKETSMEVAYQRILQKIIHEKMEPGAPLREDHLAREFGFSSTPVREAFRRLEYEGWVQSFPYKGSFLRSYTPEEIEELYLLRESIEGIAVGRAAEKATAEDWRRIEAALAAERRYIEELESEASGAVRPSRSPDIDFHQAIVQAAHSALLLDRANTLRAQLNCIVLSARLASSLAAVKAVHDEHRMIHQAMCRRWDRIAEELIRRHIASARIKYLKEVEAAAPAPSPPA